MTIYEVIVNGKSYDVAVRKKKTTSTSSLSIPNTAVSEESPVISVPKTIAQAPTAMTVSAVGSGGKKVIAPMPGKIMAIKVSVGDRVNRGQELVILEAMKMNNSILAANDGVITEIVVQVNDPVQSGQTLLSIG